jgi:hypothetical protein
MAHIVVADAQTWLEGTKARLTSLDPNLESQISIMILGRMVDTFDTTIVASWVDNNTTPEIVRQIIAMTYAGWYYDRQFSEQVIGAGTQASNVTTYGMLLRQYAETLLEGVISGSIILVEVPLDEPQTLPVFYPTDTSSTTDALINNTDPDDNSLGPAAFGMQKVF